MIRRVENHGYATTSSASRSSRRRRILRSGDRRARRRQPDDRARLQRARVPGRLSRQYGPRHRQRAPPVLGSVQPPTASRLWRSPITNPRRTRNRSSEKEESKRLLYVAMTRLATSLSVGNHQERTVPDGKGSARRAAAEFVETMLLTTMIYTMGRVSTHKHSTVPPPFTDHPRLFGHHQTSDDIAGLGDIRIFRAGVPDGGAARRGGCLSAPRRAPAGTTGSPGATRRTAVGATTRFAGYADSTADAAVPSRAR